MSTGTLVVTPVRAALAAAVLGGAVAEGLSGTGVLLAAGLGAILLVFGAASARRPRTLDRFPPPPASARVCPWWESGLRAALPSTVGLALLGSVALGFSRELAGVCGGLLGGLAIFGLATGFLLLAEERREQRRLFVDWSIVQPRLYAAPGVGG